MRTLSSTLLRVRKPTLPSPGYWGWALRCLSPFSTTSLLDKLCLGRTVKPVFTYGRCTIQELQQVVTYGLESIKSKGTAAEMGVEESMAWVTKVASGINHLGNSEPWGFYNMCELMFNQVYKSNGCSQARIASNIFCELKQGRSDLLHQFLNQVPCEGR